MVLCKEVIAEKGQIHTVMRLIGHDLFIKGMPTNQYYQLLANMKQKKALKGHRHIPGWVKLTFIDEIPDEGLKGEFLNAMITSFNAMNFVVTVRDIELNAR